MVKLLDKCFLMEGGKLIDFKINRFIPLRNYTQYSLSKGALRINELIEFCKKENVPAAAITDFDNLFTFSEFCIECKDQFSQS